MRDKAAPSACRADGRAGAGRRNGASYSVKMPTPEDKSADWRDVLTMMGDQRVQLGPYFSYILLKTPRRLLHLLSYYKFAAKMIGKNKRVIEVGCSEGVGTILLAEHAASCLGVDLDAASIDIANATVASDRLTFRCMNVFDAPPGSFDAAVALDTIEHIETAREDDFVGGIAALLESHGVFVCGTPNITSDQYASAHTKLGHINLYSAERLGALMERHFHNVFLFSANDEVVHTGFSPMAHYLIALGVGPRAR
jgi:2-polyprenyl-3-methyl-5-hydroxy-6-metoxy-1,4-benzoquinol methylase